MVVEACLTAATTCLYTNFQELGRCRFAREFQPFLLGQGARPGLLRSGCLQLKPPQFEDHRIFKNLCSDIDQSVCPSSAVPKPVIVDVQDARPDSVLFSFGIAEKCARHEKILQFLTSGSHNKEKRGLDVSLVSDLMGLHTLAIDMRHLSAASIDEDFCLYEMASNSSLSQLSEFYIPKPVMDFVEVLSKNSMFTVHPDGKLLFTGTAAEVKNLLSVLSEFCTKNTPNWSKQGMLVPHFNRLDYTDAGVYVPGSSLKLQAVPVAPGKSTEKLNLKTAPGKKTSRRVGKEKDLYMTRKTGKVKDLYITRKGGKERDLYSKNYFHACESLLSLLIDKKRCRRTTMLSLKKSGPELSKIVTQLSTGIAGTGLAVIFSVACKIAGTGVPFSATKLLSTGFGFGLVWLSCAVNELGDAIFRITKRPGKVGPTEDEKMRGIERILNEIMFRASSLMVMAVLRFV